MGSLYDCLPLGGLRGGLSRSLSNKQKLAAVTLLRQRCKGATELIRHTSLIVEQCTQHALDLCLFENGYLQQGANVEPPMGVNNPMLANDFVRAHLTWLRLRLTSLQHNAANWLWPWAVGVSFTPRPSHIIGNQNGHPLNGPEIDSTAHFAPLRLVDTPLQGQHNVTYLDPSSVSVWEQSARALLQGQAAREGPCKRAVEMHAGALQNFANLPALLDIGPGGRQTYVDWMSYVTRASPRLVSNQTNFVKSHIVSHIKTVVQAHVDAVFAGLVNRRRRHEIRDYVVAFLSPAWIRRYRPANAFGAAHRFWAVGPLRPLRAAHPQVVAQLQTALRPLYRLLYYALDVDPTVPGAAIARARVQRLPQIGAIVIFNVGVNPQGRPNAVLPIHIETRADIRRHSWSDVANGSPVILGRLMVALRWCAIDYRRASIAAQPNGVLPASWKGLEVHFTKTKTMEDIIDLDFVPMVRLVVKPLAAPVPGQMPISLPILHRQNGAHFANVLDMLATPDGDHCFYMQQIMHRLFGAAAHKRRQLHRQYRWLRRGGHQVPLNAITLQTNGEEIRLRVELVFDVAHGIPRTCYQSRIAQADELASQRPCLHVPPLDVPYPGTQATGGIYDMQRGPILPQVEVAGNLQVYADTGQVQHVRAQRVDSGTANERLEDERHNVWAAQFGAFEAGIIKRRQLKETQRHVSGLSSAARRGTTREEAQEARARRKNSEYVADNDLDGLSIDEWLNVIRCRKNLVAGDAGTGLRDYAVLWHEYFERACLFWGRKRWKIKSERQRRNQQRSDNDRLARFVLFLIDRAELDRRGEKLLLTGNKRSRRMVERKRKAAARHRQQRAAVNPRRPAPVYPLPPGPALAAVDASSGSTYGRGHRATTTSTFERYLARQGATVLRPSAWGTSKRDGASLPDLRRGSYAGIHPAAPAPLAHAQNPGQMIKTLSTLRPRCNHRAFNKRDDVTHRSEWYCEDGQGQISRVSQCPAAAMRRREDKRVQGCDHAACARPAFQLGNPSMRLHGTQVQPTHVVHRDQQSANVIGYLVSRYLQSQGRPRVRWNAPFAVMPPAARWAAWPGRQAFLNDGNLFMRS